MSDADRGRVPFAFVGVLLLVSSATIAATNQPRSPPAEPAVSKAMDRGAAEVQTALRDAVTRASRDAARAPVVDRANTTAGRALNASDPFRDALRIRIYLAARETLERIDRRRESVRVTASLPPVENESDLREVKRRVRVEPGDENGTTIRVHVENVTLTASRDGRVVTERRLAPTLVVGTPVLALHDRVDAYQRRLDADVTKPGLDQRVTAQMYALTWARGYAQYGGAPIDNVVTNRYVALATNTGLLDVQRATIGRSDADGRRTLAVETGKLAGSELLSASGVDAPPVRESLDAPRKPAPNDVPGLEPPAGTRRDDEMAVRVNDTADEAFLAFVENGGLNRSVRTVYSADARILTDVDRLGGDTPSAPPSPGPNWTRDGERTVVDSRTGETAVTSPPPTPTGFHRFETFGREVTVERTRVADWRNGNRTRNTSRSATERLRVSVAVVGRHATSESAPERGIETVHERGEGPLDGPNLADVERRAVDRLVEGQGGRDAVVGRAALGTANTDTETIRADRPDGVYRWVYHDLRDLRERIRAIRIQVERGKVGSFEANPPALLAQRLRDRRATLVDAPSTYGSTASKARVAARAAYLDAVVDRLEEQAANRRDRGQSLGDVLDDRGAGSLSELQAGLDAKRESTPERRPTIDGPAGPVRLRVDSAPSYLTRAEIERERVPALDGPGHPLVARNVNLFTVPYGDVSNAVVDELVGSGGDVRLGTAARTLRAANATLERRGVERVEDRRDALQSDVAVANAYVRARMCAALGNHDVGQSRADRRAIVAAGLGRWETTAARSLAIANGSASEAVVRAAADRTSLDATERDLLELKLQRRTEAALERPKARPEADVVDRSRNATRDVANELTAKLAGKATRRGIEYARNESFDEVPSGLPLAPPVTAWYATTNVWHVTVRGEYARFGIRTDRGRPDRPGAGLAYVRDGSAVSFDVDGDGEAERLGRATRVDFDVSTTVVVVVPPGKSGVGDRDGNADETSDGWPAPGPG